MSSRTFSVAVAVSAIVGGDAERAEMLADAEIRGPEIVAPLGDAVGLVDGDEADAALREQRLDLGRAEASPASSSREPARRHDPLEDVPARLAADGAVEPRRRDVAPRSFCSWSWSSASSGEITITGSGSIIDGIW